MARLIPKKNRAMKACGKAFRILIEMEVVRKHEKENVEPEQCAVRPSDGMVHDVMPDPEDSQADERHEVTDELRPQGDQCRRHLDIRSGRPQIGNAELQDEKGHHDGKMLSLNA